MKRTKARRSVWVLYYTGKFCEAYLRKSGAAASVRSRMIQYYTKREDYEIVRYDSSK